MKFGLYHTARFAPLWLIVSEDFLLRGCLLIVRTQRFLPLRQRYFEIQPDVPAYTPDFSTSICFRKLNVSPIATARSALSQLRKTPHLNCLSSTVFVWFSFRTPRELDFKLLKMGVSLSDPRHPKAPFQILPTTLRIKTLKPIPNCSKASGVFSSRCRYPASSRESHFHRACR